MAAPTLADYEYQYKDSGFKLNGGAVLPFFDVMKVTGLDLPDYDAQVDDTDSLDGGTIYVKYSKTRTVVIEGILYASPSQIEVTIEQLIQNFVPDNTDWPLYYKHPGVLQKYVMGKSFGFKSDIETLRRIGAANCQIIIGCENPLKRIDNTDLILANGVNSPVSNSGPAKTWPTITITGGVGTSVSLTNNSTNGTLVLSRAFAGSDVTVVDMRNRVVYVNGIQNSSVVSSGSFWGLDGGSTRNIKYTWTGATVPTSVVVRSYSGWM